MAVKIRDIAHKAGVSQMTVSRVLRGSGNVSDDTRKAVQLVADELGYSPQNLVLSPTRGRNGRNNSYLKVVMPFFGYGGQYTLAHESDHITQNGKSLSQRFNNSLSLSLKRAGGFLEKVLVEDIDEFESSWARWGANGIVLRQSVPINWVSRLRKIAPVVNACSFDMQDGVDVVYTNEHRSAANIFSYLSSNGHRNILWFDVIHENCPFMVNSMHFGKNEAIDILPETITSVRHSAWAYIKFLAGKDYNNQILLLRKDHRKFTLADAVAEAIDAVLSSDQLPTAIVCAHDNIAVDMLKLLNERGLNVPEDVSLVGFCGFQSAINSTPSISTVDLPMVEIGAVVPELIKRRLASPSAIAMSLQFETKLIKGQSVKNIAKTSNCKTNEDSKDILKRVV